MIAADGESLYLGSANFTGAGLGEKSDGRRNFELGVVTNDDVLLDTAQARFDRIWSGAECAGCKLRRECPKPLDTLGRTSARAPTAPVKPRARAPRAPKRAAT
jgi:phosphatidylserine/phosphatidylglycerophosphate/cardiolipin synthase-like enzyme